jgi:predicted O-methyltransferase YrrM
VSAFSKTAQYAGLTDLPPLVARAVALANELGFISCCFPEQGRLLQVLARGRAGGVIGETGTGCGAGLAWMASAVGPDTRLISVEQDATRAAACRTLFAAMPNVRVLDGDWRLIEPHGPFDLLVLDGGGGAKREGDADGRSLGAARKHWLEHPALFAAEIRVHPLVSTILGTRKASRL